jgi:hypothetical protein
MVDMEDTTDLGNRSPEDIDTELVQLNLTIGRFYRKIDRQMDLARREYNETPMRHTRGRTGGSGRSLPLTK